MTHLRYPFDDGNIVSARRDRHELELYYAADVVVCLSTMRVLKDRYGERTKQPDLVMVRLYEAIEADEKVVVLV